MLLLKAEISMSSFILGAHRYHMGVGVAGMLGGILALTIPLRLSILLEYFSFSFSSVDKSE